MLGCVDFHTHIFPDHVAARAIQALTQAYGAQAEGSATAAGLMAAMEQAGVDRAVVCPVATRPDQVASINRWVVNLDRQYFLPFGALHPGSDDLAQELAFLRDHDVRGVKLQPHFQGYQLDDPAALRMIEQLADLVILIHGGQEIREIPKVLATPELLRALHDRFPSHRLVVAHLGGYRMWESVREHLLGQDVYLDLAYTFNRMPDQEIAEIISAHGPEHILFASDYPWQLPEEARVGLGRLGLPEEQQHKIMGGNASALLRL